MMSLHIASVLLVLLGGCSAEDQLYKTPQIYSMHIHSDITYRYSTTKVTSRMKNPGEKAREALFDVTLPNEAFITNLTIEIDGNITVGEIKEKQVAKQEYIAARERGESAGYIGTKHRETNKFVLAISVAPLSKISFNLTYQELLKRKLGYYEHEIFIDPKQTVEDLDVTVSILESRNITRLNVPALRNDVGDSVAEVENIVLKSQPTPNSALVMYAPTVEQQLLQSKEGLAGRFVVQYDVQRDLDIGDVMMVNGYFVHFFAPEGLQPIPNDVLFILDVSGSMQGKKLGQLKTAMLSNLQQLLPEDRFNMMTFSSGNRLWRQTMADVGDEDAMEEANNFISSLKAGGWTNIDSALTKGLSFLAEQISQGNGTRSPIIVFLTDGEPTNGEMVPENILNNVEKLNEGDIPIFTLAFGQNAAWDFVKKLALENNGFGRKIYEASDAALQIMGFYSEISVTLLSNVTFNYLDAETANVTKTHFSNYFNGSEMTVCGFLPDFPSEIDVEVKFKSAMPSGMVVLTGVAAGDVFGDVGNYTEMKNYEDITEKVWAYLTIKQLLEKKTVAQTQKEIDSLKSEVLRLSLKYGFVTPLTSMVVTQSEESPKDALIELDETDADMDVNSNRRHRITPMRGAHSPVGMQHALAFDPSRQAFPSMSDPIIPPVPVASKTFIGPPVRAANAHAINGGYPSADLSKRVLGGSKPKSRPKTAKSNRRRAKGKKSKRRERKFMYPLEVSFDGISENFCFSLYHDDFRHGSATYKLSEGNDVQINLKLYSKAVGRKVHRGSVKELQIVAPDDQIIIDSASIMSGLSTDSAFFEISWTKGKAVSISVGGTLYFVRYSSAQDEFSIYVSGGNNFVSDDGILDQIFKNTIEIKRVHKRGRKTTVIVSINSKTTTLIEKMLLNPMGLQKSCLVTKKKERVWYNMEDEKM